jgi:hypothetical protein
MSSLTGDVKGTSASDGTFNIPTDFHDRELLLREREVVAREREVALHSEEIGRSRWSNPLVIGLLAAALSLAGNLAVALINSIETQKLERYKARTALVTELIKTGNTEAAVRNLKFFADNGLLDDPDGTIRRALSTTIDLPVLPAPAVPTSLQGYLSELFSPTSGIVEVTSVPPGAHFLIDGSVQGVTNATVRLSIGQHRIVADLAAILFT